MSDPACIELERQLYREVCSQWLDTLSSEAYRTHPLAMYVFAPAFAESLRAVEPSVPIQRVAWVCAMIACGLAGALHQLRLEPLLDDAQQTRRAHSARGWRCELLPATNGFELCFWTRAERIEFDRIGRSS